MIVLVSHPIFSLGAVSPGCENATRIDSNGKTFWNTNSEFIDLVNEAVSSGLSPEQFASECAQSQSQEADNTDQNNNDPNNQSATNETPQASDASGQTPGTTSTPTIAAKAAAATAINPAWLALGLAGAGGGGGGGGGGGSGAASGSCTSSGNSAASFETAEYLASYALKEINASSAYALGCTGQGVTVAVLDGPSDSDHPDLDANYVTGWDASHSDTNSDCGRLAGCTGSHGVHVAGIIAAEKNGSGMHGVAYNAKIKPIAIFDDADSDDTNTVQLATAISQGSGSSIAVMNNSWGAATVKTYSSGGSTRYYVGPVSGSSLSATELNAWKTAVQTTVVVFANGNDGQNNLNGRMHSWSSNAGASSGSTAHADYLGYLTTSAETNQNLPSWRGSYFLTDANLIGKWLTVVALNENDAITSYSNGCGVAKNYCISAPGGELNFGRDAGIYSTVNQSDSTESGDYAYKQGTSMAAPVVSGSIALLKEQFPNLTPTQLVDLLISTATDLGAAGVDEVYGVGKINLGSAATPQGFTSVVDFRGNPIPNSHNSSTYISLSPIFNYVRPESISLGVFDKYKRAYEWLPQIKSETVNFSVRDNFSKINAHEDQILYKNRSFELGILGLSEGINEDEQFVKKYFANSEMNGSRIKVAYVSNHDKQREKYLDPENIYFIEKIFPVFEKATLVESETNISDDTKLLNYSFIVKNKGTSASSFGTKIEKHNHNFELELGLSSLLEHQSVLGSKFSGAFELESGAKSIIFEAGFKKQIEKNFLINGHANFSKTRANFRNQDLIEISNISARELSLGFELDDFLKEKQKLLIDVIYPLSVTNGELTIKTIEGYRNGDYNQVSNRLDLVPDNGPQIINGRIERELGFGTIAVGMTALNHFNNEGHSSEEIINFELSSRF